jgi:hypothetical protein
MLFTRNPSLEKSCSTHLDGEEFGREIVESADVLERADVDFRQEIVTIRKSKSNTVRYVRINDEVKSVLKACLRKVGEERIFGLLRRTVCHGHSSSRTGGWDQGLSTP